MKKRMKGYKAKLEKDYEDIIPSMKAIRKPPIISVVLPMQPPRGFYIELESDIESMGFLNMEICRINSVRVRCDNYWDAYLIMKLTEIEAYKDVRITRDYKYLEYKKDDYSRQVIDFSKEDASFKLKIGIGSIWYLNRIYGIVKKEFEDVSMVVDSELPTPPYILIHARIPNLYKDLLDEDILEQFLMFYSGYRFTNRMIITKMFGDQRGYLAIASIKNKLDFPGGFSEYFETYQKQIYIGSEWASQVNGRSLKKNIEEQKRVKEEVITNENTWAKIGAVRELKEETGLVNDILDRVNHFRGDFFIADLSDIGDLDIQEATCIHLNEEVMIIEEPENALEWFGWCGFLTFDVLEKLYDSNYIDTVRLVIQEYLDQLN